MMKSLYWLLFLPSLCFGVYVGNPANPALMSTGFFSGHYPFLKGTSGYIYDYTSNKKYDHGKIGRFGLHSQMGSFSLILVERMEFFGAVGQSKEKADRMNFSDAASFSWSAGSKVILLQWGQTYLSCDFTYFAIPSSTAYLAQWLDRFHIPFQLPKQHFHLREWQGSGALSSRFGFFTPYIGLSYLSSHLSAEDFSFRNAYSLGYFYGATISLTGRFHLNFERRVRSESAYTFSTIAVF